MCVATLYICRMLMLFAFFANKMYNNTQSKQFGSVEFQDPCTLYIDINDG